MNRTESERKFVQSLAGVKSNYTKKINFAKSHGDRKAADRLRKECAAEIARRTAEFQEFSKKEVQREAGRKSWVTRRAREQAKEKLMDAVFETSRGETAAKTAETTGRARKTRRQSIRTSAIVPAGVVRHGISVSSVKKNSKGKK